MRDECPYSVMLTKAGCWTCTPKTAAASVGNLLSDAELWQRFCQALDEGKVAVILEDTRDSIDGGTIVTDIDEVIDHLALQTPGD